MTQAELPLDKPTAKTMLMEVLADGKPRAIHEFDLPYSQNNLATRLNDLEREGRLSSRYRDGKNFKEWMLP